MAIIILIIGCNSTEKESVVSAEYKKDMDNWVNKRIKNLKKETGWLNLVGLH